MMSVTKASPSLKNIAPMAGSTAKARGMLCHVFESFVVGSNISSADVFAAEKEELREGGGKSSLLSCSIGNVLRRMRRRGAAAAPFGVGIPFVGFVGDVAPRSRSSFAAEEEGIIV
jgi:hypothetical protein